MSAARRKVLLVGWDGADWQHIHPLLKAGQMPTLAQLLENGVMANLATLQPVLSPMLWNSVATGKYADKHGIHGFIEPDLANGGARPATSYSRKTRALWNMLTLSGLTSNVVGWWASHPAEHIAGNVVTNSLSGIKYDPSQGWQYPTGTFYPESRATELSRCRVFPTELDQQHLLPFIPEAASIDQEKDPRLFKFAKSLAEAASIQAAGTLLMEEAWDFTALYFDCIDHLCHGFMKFYPPQLPGIADEDFNFYKDVIPGAYRFHDMMLARQLQLAGPETTVIICSDHGFDAGPLRAMASPNEPAGPAEDHRDYGILVMSGPGIRRNERIYGASLIDMAPTILHLFGLPVGEDMDGRVLLEAFEEPGVIQTIPSWDTLKGDCGMHCGEESLTSEQSDELLHQFAALGYIDDPDKDKAELAIDAQVEQWHNLARQYIWLQKYDQARELCEKLLHTRPWETRFITQLADCYYRCGFIEQCSELLARAFDLDSTGNLGAMLMAARCKLALGDEGAGRDLLKRVEQSSVPIPGLYVELGQLHLRNRDFESAERYFAAAVGLQPENAQAHQGLSTVFCRLGDNDATIAAALEAVGLVHRLPEAHFNLGIALARSGHYQRAITAFKVTLRVKPDHYNAHRWLARLYRALPDGRDQFIHHYAETERTRKRWRQRRLQREARRETRFDLPEIPTESERASILERERPGPQHSQEPSGKTFVLVSGLPRSGTSLMMQMLEAGGLPPKTDGERQPDDGNPRGYYEWQALKKIGRRRDLLDEEGLEGMAIKAVTALLQKMPRKHRYKVVFMMRPIEEVAFSQSRLLELQGSTAPDLDEAELERRLEGHRGELLNWLSEAEHVELATVDYHDLLRDPGSQAQKLQAFLGSDRLPHPDNMSKVVDPTLYRSRISDAGSLF